MKKYLVTEELAADHVWGAENPYYKQTEKTEIPPDTIMVTREQVYEALRLVSMDKDVEDILDELFGVDG